MRVKDSAPPCHPSMINTTKDPSYPHPWSQLYGQPPWFFSFVIDTHFKEPASLNGQFLNFSDSPLLSSHTLLATCHLAYIVKVIFNIKRALVPPFQVLCSNLPFLKCTSTYIQRWLVGILMKGVMDDIRFKVAIFRLQ